MSKEGFKEFVKKNTNLINYVENGKTDWQHLYELYDLYGENSNIWEKYQIKNSKTNSEATKENSNQGFKDFLNLIKGLDLETVRKGINSIDKAIETFKELGESPKKEEPKYEPRPTFKYFED